MGGKRTLAHPTPYAVRCPAGDRLAYSRCAWFPASPAVLPRLKQPACLSSRNCRTTAGHLWT